MDVSTCKTVELPITIDKKDLINNLWELIFILKPQWDQSNVKHKIFSDGITNSLVGVFQISDKHNMILVRVFGENTEKIIDRNAELKNMKILHTLGFGPALYASFSNGLAYQYLPGEILTVKTCLNEKIYPKVAEKMAQFHLQYDNVKERLPTEERNSFGQSILWTKLMNFIKLCPEKYCSGDTSKDKLLEELKWLEGTLVHLNNHLVFCHNDLLLANILYDKDQNVIAFIDFEYAGPNYQAYDIANHFCEFSGVEDFNTSRYPDEEFRKNWVTCYLKTFCGGQDVGNETVQLLLHHIELFTLASHFFWGVWSLIQAANSSIDFDFEKYSSLRLNEYFKKKIFLRENQE
ncbi:ethanolamine kinase 1-like isoform X1 [Daphnia pulex]|uniref:ethanolamine kinase 1-like isoform X1 n=1 Tax=Daphnia pulex TaxID=6669 RepID=UPI001EE02A7D|nr:ethanolamine kinase 1-like isoform X1 [Daphnia pulex]